MISPTDYRATFGHASGQRILDDLWQQFWGDVMTYAPGIPALDLAFREGQRSVIVMLRAAVHQALHDTDTDTDTVETYR